MAVDVQNLPAQPFENLGLIRTVAAGSGPGELNLVGIVKDNELSQLPETGQGGCAMHHGLLKVAVGSQDVGEMVHGFPAQLLAQKGLGGGHANGHGEALSQGAGGGLDSGGNAYLRMTGGAAVHLPEGLEVIQAQKSAKMQHGIEQCGLVSGGEHEPVPIEPGSVVRVEIQEFAEQDIGEIRRGHCPARMTGISLAHGVHDQTLDHVHHFLIHVVAHVFLLDFAQFLDQPDAPGVPFSLETGFQKRFHNGKGESRSDDPLAHA